MNTPTILAVLTAAFPLLTPTLRAQQAGSSLPGVNVLQLDGVDGCVELPPDIFNSLTESTVEAG